jgi:hypothetical protein
MVINNQNMRMEIDRTSKFINLFIFSKKIKSKNKN